MFSIDGIAISQQKAGGGLFREGFNHLLRGPPGSRMGRHIEMDHLPSVMQQHDEAVQNIESHSRHREEINCGNLSSVILKETLPGL